jgi:hypothetical protein
MVRIIKLHPHTNLKHIQAIDAGNEINTTFSSVDKSLTKHKEKGIIDIITDAVADFKKLMEFEKGWNINSKYLFIK